MGDADECSGHCEFAERHYQSGFRRLAVLSVEAIASLRDRLPWFWFFFTVAVLLLSAMDRYHIVSQFKQRERVVIIDPAGDPKP